MVSTKKAWLFLKVALGPIILSKKKKKEQKPSQIKTKWEVIMFTITKSDLY